MSNNIQISRLLPINIKYPLWALMLLLLAVGLLSSGCSGANDENPKVDSSSTKAADAEVDDKRLGAADIPDEVYGDLDTFSTPRLQFVVRIKESGLPEIWSSRLDGSDVRRVVSAALLSTPKPGAINHPPVRSPDNRYIVYSTNPEGPIEKRIIDLKEKTVEVIATGGGIPSFQWTPDSNNIIFGLVGGEYNDLVQYNVTTKKLSKKKVIKTSGGFYLVPHNKHIISMTYNGFAEYDFDGELIREVTLAERIHKYSLYNVSRDGKLLMYRIGGTTYVINPNDYENILATFSVRPGLFHPNGKEVLYLDGGNLMKINMGTLDTSLLLDLKNRIFHISIYNDE